MHLKHLYFLAIDFIFRQFLRLRKNIFNSAKKAIWPLRMLRLKKKLAVIPRLPVYLNHSDITFVFAPEAAIPSSSAGMATIARTLQDQGHKVLVSQCFKSFATCPVILSKRKLVDGYDQAHSALCPVCVDASITRSKEYGIESLDLRSLHTKKIDQVIQKAIQDAPDNLLEFEFDSIAFGKICTVDLVLATKIYELEQAKGSIRVAWLRLIEGSLQSYLLMQELLRRLPIKRVLYFNNYALNLGVSLASRKHNIPVLGVTFAYHRNVDFRRYIIFSSAYAVHANEMLRAWPEWSQIPLGKNRVGEIADDIVTRFGGGGSHVYSAAKSHDGFDAYAKFALDKNRKLIVAYTSSLDELVAGKAVLEGQGIELRQSHQPFRDQIEWLQELTAYVAQSTHLQLVIRIHPREGANHRDTVESEHLKKIQSKFKAKIPHCHFVWPEDTTSSYDLAECADLALTSWSSIGVELARLAIPVLAAFKFPEIVYPYGSFIQSADSKTGYFFLLEELLQQPISIETVQQAYRWYNLYNLSLSIDLSDVVPTSDCTEPPRYKLSSKANVIEDAIINGKNILAVNMEVLKSQQHKESAIEELHALKHQCRRLIHFFCTGEDDQQAESKLELLRESDQISNNDALQSTSKIERKIVANGPTIDYCSNGQTYRRVSPMLVRLIQIAFATDSQKKYDDDNATPTRKVA